MAKRKQKGQTQRPKAGAELSPGTPATSARQVVFLVLERYRRTGEFVAESLRAEAARAALGLQDRRLAREMVSGIIRRQATLDALITPHVRRPRENIEAPLWLLLQMGVYELAFLAGIPPHASVNENTELARFLDRPRWTGFLNGTLRSVSRSLREETTDSPAADAFPVAKGLYRKIATALFSRSELRSAGLFRDVHSVFPFGLPSAGSDGARSRNLQSWALGSIRPRRWCCESIC